MSDIAAEIKAARRQRREDDKVLALAPLCEHCGVGADLPARQHGPTCKLRVEQNAPWTPPPDAVMTLPGIDVPQPETSRVAAEAASPTKALSLEQIETQCSPTTLMQPERKKVTIRIPRDLDADFNFEVF